jgi:CBS domain-containing protein
VKVKDFMIKDVITGHPNESIKEIMTKLVENQIGGLPICSEEGQLIGMVSDGDILRAIKPINPHLYHYMIYMVFDKGQDLETRIGNLADTPILNITKTKGIISVCENDNMEKAVELLAKHHFKKLPVIDPNSHIVGVISRGDVIRKIQTSLLDEY